MNDQELRALELEDIPKIVAVGIISESFELLCGKRKDNGKWSCPGGHLEPGEGVMEAARREAMEEAGVSLQNPRLVFYERVDGSVSRSGKPFAVFGVVSRQQRTNTLLGLDPDDEFSELSWVPITAGAEELKPENRHAFKDGILEYLGLPCLKESP